MKSIKDTKTFKKIFKDKNSFEKLDELVGRIAVLTFRNKSIHQYTKYKIISIADGFLYLRGLEQDPARPPSSPWHQALSEVDTIRLTNE